MIFFEQKPAKILQFRSKLRLIYSNKNASLKLSDVITKSCLKCGKYEKKLIVYERLYIGNPGVKIRCRRFWDYVDVEICKECFAELNPKCEF